MSAVFRNFRQWVTAYKRRRALFRQIGDILERVDSMPTLDDRSAEEILCYDEHGLPLNLTAYNASALRLD